MSLGRSSWKNRENKKVFSSLECQSSDLQDSDLIRVGEIAPLDGGLLSLLQSIQSSALLQARGCCSLVGNGASCAVVTFSLTAGHNCGVESAVSINETYQ